MAASPIEKKLELEKSRKKFFEDSKFDATNQKYGLFSFPGTLAVSNRPYFQETKPKKNNDGTVQTGPRNFLASHVKRGKTPDAYFSYPEYIPEKYSAQKQPFKSDKERADQMRKKHEEMWRPGGKVNESSILFPHEASETFRTIKRKQPDGTVRLEARNFYTSPPKKGSNTPGVLFGPYPEHMPDPYERKERLNKEKGSKFRAVSHDAPFVSMEKGGKTFTKDADVYGGDFKAPSPKRSVSQKFPKQDLPFRPPNPSHGTIGNFPEYIPNPQPVVKRKPPSTLEPWRATTTVKTAPSVSIVSNVKNIRAEYPMLRRLN